MIDDSELLQRYVEGDERAFSDLVLRHVNLVYSAAIRRVGHDRQLAEEVAQTVFAHCARKAKSLQHHPALSGWLHRSTRFAAIDSLRAQRRHLAIQSLATMNSETAGADESDRTWREIRPEIDALLDRLREDERHTVALRFFEGDSFAEIGARLRISEATARMRVERALEKLRRALAQRGVRSTTATLGLALASHAVEVAPLGLAHAVSAGAIAATQVGSSGIAAATFFFMSKTKAVAVGAIAVSLTAIVFESRANLGLQKEAAGLRREFATQTPSSLVVNASAPPEASPLNRSELERLRARIVELKSRPDGVVDTEIKLRRDWKNAGRASPTAAFETFIWSGESDDYSVLAKSFFLGDETKTNADAYFAALPVELQIGYGSPERLIAPFIASRPKAFRLETLQVIDLIPGNRPDLVTVRYWARTEGGPGRVDTLPFQRFGDECSWVHARWACLCAPRSSSSARRSIRDSLSTQGNHKLGKL